MADAPGNFDPKAYQQALNATNNILNNQKEMKKLTDGTRDTWNSISNNIMNISGAEFFDKVKKTPADLTNIANHLTEIRDGIKTIGEELDKSFLGKTEGLQKDFAALAKWDLSKGVKDLASSMSQLNSGSMKELSDLLETKVGRSIEDMSLVDFKKETKEIMKEWDTYKDSLTEINKDTLKEILEKTEDQLNAYKDIDKEMKSITREHSELLNIADETLRKDLAIAIAKGEISKFVEKYGDDAAVALNLFGKLDGETMSIAGNMAATVEQQKAFVAEAQKSHKEVFKLGKGMEKLGSNIKKQGIDRMFQFDQAISDAQKDFGIMFKGVGFEGAAAMTNLTMKTAEFGMSVGQTVQLMGMLSEEIRSVDKATLMQMTESMAAVQKATGLSAEATASLAGDLINMGADSERVEAAFKTANVHAKLMGVSTKRVLVGMERNIKKMREFGFQGGEESLAKMTAQAERLRINVDSIFNVAEKARSIEGAMDMAAELQLAAGSFSNINPMDLLSAARKGPEEMQKILKQMGGDIGEFNEKTGEMTFDPVDADRLRIVADATGMSVTDMQNMFAKTAQDNAKLSLFPESMFEFDGGEEAKGMIADMMAFNKDTGKMEVKADSDLSKILDGRDLSMLGPDEIKSLAADRTKRAQDLEAQAMENKSLKDSWSALVDTLVNTFTIFQPAIEWLAGILGDLNRALNMLPGWGKTLVGGLMAAAFLFKTSIGQFIASAAKGGISKAAGGGGGLLGGINKKTTEVAGKTPKGGGGGFLGTLANGIKAFRDVKMKDILKVTASLVGISVGLAAFAGAMSIMGGFEALPQLAMASLSLIVLGTSVVLLSKLMGNVDIGNLLKGALAMVIVGASLLPFALAMQMMSEIDWTSVLIAMGVMFLAVLALMGLGALLMGPQLLFLLIGVGVLIMVGAALLVAAAGLLLAAEAFQALANIDWGGFSQMGDALLSVVPGLLGFSLAAMSFLNPFAILGLIVMIGLLSGLAAVMQPLAEFMTIAADGMDRFSEGLERLNAAVAALDMDRLEEFADISEGLANAAAMGNLATAMQELSSNMGSGGSGGSGGNKSITIDLKLNGRDVQQIIVDDNELTT